MVKYFTGSTVLIKILMVDVADLGCIQNKQNNLLLMKSMVNNFRNYPQMSNRFRHEATQFESL